MARSTKKPLGYVCRLTSEEDAYQSTEMVVIAAVALQTAVVPIEESIDTDFGGSDERGAEAIGNGEMRMGPLPTVKPREDYCKLQNECHIFPEMSETL